MGRGTTRSLSVQLTEKSLSAQLTDAIRKDMARRETLINQFKLELDEVKDTLPHKRASFMRDWDDANVTPDDKNPTTLSNRQRPSDVIPERKISRCSGVISEMSSDASGPLPVPLSIAVESNPPPFGKPNELRNKDITWI